MSYGLTGRRDDPASGITGISQTLAAPSIHIFIAIFSMAMAIATAISTGKTARAEKRR